MMKSKRIISCLLAVMLVFGAMPLTTFAYADAAQGQTVETAADETDADEDAPKSEEESDAEIPYTYTISEDGSITIIINGQEWNIPGADTEEKTIVGKVVTQGSRLNLRTGAGMNYEIIDQLRPGEEVTVIGTEGDWYKVIVPEKTGYVHSDYLELLESAEENSDIDAAILMLLLNMMFQNMNTETESQPTFTPGGNLSLIDDILQTEVYATEDTELKEKQFITLQSKSGNYFYLVIDRTGDTENVYFMNLVDEADLMALIEKDESAADAPVCVCTEKCAVGAIHTGCEICRTNMSECAGKEPEPEPTVEPTEPAEEPKEQKSNPMILLLVVALMGSGAFAYFKFFKNKSSTKGNADLDDYDYGDEEDDDIPWESEDDETADKENSEDNPV